MGNYFGRFDLIWLALEAFSSVSDCLASGRLGVCQRQGFVCENAYGRIVLSLLLYCPVFFMIRSPCFFFSALVRTRILGKKEIQ